MTIQVCNVMVQKTNKKNALWQLYQKNLNPLFDDTKSTYEI
jgi:hypothetical protein